MEIIGSGEEEATLKDLCKQLKIEQKVVFTGRIPRELVISHMRDADLFVMVSTNETLGLVYLEAMAQGCITIGTQGEGIDGVIIDGINGYLVEPLKEESLLEKMLHIKSLDILERKKILINGYNTAVKMTDENMALDYLDKIKRQEQKLL